MAGADQAETLADWDKAHPETPSAPFAVNQIVHKTNNRLEQDVELCAKHRVPVDHHLAGRARGRQRGRARLGRRRAARRDQPDAFASKAIEKGADGLIPVAAGAGGHAGGCRRSRSIQELREWFDGPIALSGAIANGRAVLAAQAMGADLAYIGSAFIATQEAHAGRGLQGDDHQFDREDIVYTNLFTGVHGNYLRPSIVAAGLDPDNLPQSDPSKMNFGSERPASGPSQSLEGNLGQRPGRRQRRQDCAGRRIDRALQKGIRQIGRSAAVMVGVLRPRFQRGRAPIGAFFNRG